MGKMKKFAEDVSVELGFGGELTNEVLNHAQKKLKINYILSLIQDSKKEKKEKSNGYKSRNKPN